MDINLKFPTCCTEGYFALSYTCHVEDRVKCHTLAGNVNGIWLYPSHVIHTRNSSFHPVGLSFSLLVCTDKPGKEATMSLVSCSQASPLPRRVDSTLGSEAGLRYYTVPSLKAEP